MSMQAGVGFSELSDSFQCGVQATKEAMQTGSLKEPALILLFSTSKHEPQKLIEGVRSVVGNYPKLFGGYSVGIITNEDLDYGGFQVGVALLEIAESNFDLFLETGLPNNEKRVGQKLGLQIQEAGYCSENALLLLYDSINRTEGRMKMNMATPLLEGMDEKLPIWPVTAGIGLCGDMEGNPTYQWFEDQIIQGTALVLGLKGNIRMDTTILHGCKPSSDYHVVTKSKGASIYEINDRPALEVIAELLGENSGKNLEDYSFFVTLGVNHGEKYGDFNEDEYTNRLCLRVDKKNGALVMFEPDMIQGTEFQLMRRSLDFSYITQKTERLFEKVADRTPVFVFYIDCTGRASAYCGLDEEEAAYVQEAVGDIPLLGIYSGVEISMIQGKPKALDWTGVLCVFSVEKGA